MKNIKIKLYKIIQKNLTLYIIGLAVILIGLTFFIGSKIATFVLNPDLSAPPQAAFYFTPVSASVKEGENFTVDVAVDSKGGNLVAGSVYVKYDPAKISVQEINTLGSVFNFEVENVVDQESGLIKITRGKPGDGVTSDTDDGFTGGNGKIATLSLKALRATPQTKLDILKEIDAKATISRSILDDGQGTDVLATVSSGTLEITPAVVQPPAPSKIKLKIDLQGRISNHALFKVEIIDKTSGKVIRTLENVDSSNHGIAEIVATGLVQNTYDMRIVVPKYLPIKIEGVVLPDDITQFNIPSLLAGNLFDRDTVINELDAGAMNEKWGGADPDADINQDKIVNDLDTKYITLNWGETERVKTP